MGTLIEDAFNEVVRLFLDNIELHTIVDNMVTEWAVIVEGGEVIGVYSAEVLAVLDLAYFDEQHPDVPAWIVSRQIGPWVKS
jgi:hypothetical protein